MLKNIFFTIVFFILDHFFLLVVINLTSLIAMRYFYIIWNDKLRASNARYISIIILIFLVISLMLFIIVVIYVIIIFILFLPELHKLMGK
jgi:hypothetical protein